MTLALDDRLALDLSPSSNSMNGLPDSSTGLTRRQERALRRRAKALKDGLSTEDKNVLRAAGVLVGAILAVNVSNAIVGGRSRAPFE